MKNDIKRSKIFLKKNAERELLQGFPWVFDNEIDYIKISQQHEKLNACNLADGTSVDVFSNSGAFLGTGIFNKKSKIVVRILTRKKNQEFNYDFFLEKIQNAYNLRALSFKERDSYRLVFSEADFLPGLIVERYVDVKNRVFLVVQFLSLCVEIFRDFILCALQEVCKPFAIYERSDVDVLYKEGLDLKKGWIPLEKCANTKDLSPIITIIENNVMITVDLENGQKTGYFLDQKFNRTLVSSLCKDKKVLDAFSHTGAFGLNAFTNGAKQVLCVDISEDACENIKTNIKLNGAQGIVDVNCCDVFDLLKEKEKLGEKYDVVILDPPAFAKSAKSITKAYGGYKEINLRAMRILNKGGILVSCSCSYFMEEEMFLDMLMHASVDAGVSLQIISKTGASPDHPILLGYPKSHYLKCVISRVI